MRLHYLLTYVTHLGYVKYEGVSTGEHEVIVSEDMESFVWRADGSLTLGLRLCLALRSALRWRKAAEWLIF